VNNAFWHFRRDWPCHESTQLARVAASVILAAHCAGACRDGLKLQPGEPKSLGELGYIDGLQAKSH